MVPLVGVVFGIIAIPLGAVAISRKETYGATGPVLGIVGLILGLLWIFYVGNIFFGVSG